MVAVFSNLAAAIQQFGCSDSVTWLPRFSNLAAAINNIRIENDPRELARWRRTIYLNKKINRYNDLARSLGDLGKW